ncbi:hypothetical protein MUG94_07985 [Arthrobacter gengyunqii]|uniref:Uncharacterized protein n=1 Tax=Arthrobacter gengyunqii TaxID=2886940 RepID=A0A9X1M3W3_9MICC|nr:hypothetical protein [Arthrobacter gengyunqii]MCC3264779.1 hypothetical protein [Arthrobacter gengyunqii]MCC3270467.1 hypothetical protein [Arthrobacter gengyunqii]UOY97651.1 hypothetical protein MUG94_07985 [Arthrobacter gengyunqii]
MTDRMKAVVLARFGGAGGLELRSIPVPTMERRRVRCHPNEPTWLLASPGEQRS